MPKAKKEKEHHKVKKTLGGVGGGGIGRGDTSVVVKSHTKKSGFLRVFFFPSVIMTCSNSHTLHVITLMRVYLLSNNMLIFLIAFVLC